MSKTEIKDQLREREVDQISKELNNLLSQNKYRLSTHRKASRIRR